MRIRVDATSLLLPGAGVRNYVHYWLGSLTTAASARGDEISTYPPGLHPQGELNHAASLCAGFGTSWRLGLVNFTNIRGNPVRNAIVAGADVFHCSQHMAHAPAAGPLTATLFDMSCWTTPQFHTKENIAATRRYGERILTRCEGIIAISDHARRDASGILAIPEERIRVIYPGIADAFFRVDNEEARQARVKYQIDRPYVLFVGCIEPRKNVRGLLAAWQMLPEQLRRDTLLVLAGPFGWEAGDLREALAGSGPGVNYLGYVSETDLPGLFAGASAFAYPSFYEGFGLPVAQAMAAGVPVVTSDRSCLPEIVGGAGMCVNPDHPEDLAATITDLLSRPDLATTLADRGRARAARFRWAVSASESLDFFHAVSGK